MNETKTKKRVPKRRLHRGFQITVSVGVWTQGESGIRILNKHLRPGVAYPKKGKHISFNLPSEVIETLNTRRGKEKLREALMGLVDTDSGIDTRTPREKALDDYRAKQKEIWRARDEKLRQGVIEGRKLKGRAA